MAIMTVVSFSSFYRSALLLYHEYLERIANLNHSQGNSVQELINQSGIIDESNILDKKRDRKKIDYIQLSLDVREINHFLIFTSFLILFALVIWIASW